jgi:hypothetical protein
MRYQGCPSRRGSSGVQPVKQSPARRSGLARPALGLTLTARWQCLIHTSGDPSRMRAALKRVLLVAIEVVDFQAAISNSVVERISAPLAASLLSPHILRR